MTQAPLLLLVLFAINFILVALHLLNKSSLILNKIVKSSNFHSVRLIIMALSKGLPSQEEVVWSYLNARDVIKPLMVTLRQFYSFYFKSLKQMTDCKVHFGSTGSASY